MRLLFVLHLLSTWFNTSPVNLTMRVGDPSNGVILQSKDVVISNTYRNGVTTLNIYKRDSLWHKLEIPDGSLRIALGGYSAKIDDWFVNWSATSIGLLHYEGAAPDLVLICEFPQPLKFVRDSIEELPLRIKEANEIKEHNELTQIVARTTSSGSAGETRSSVEQRIRKAAADKYPNDYSMQKYVIDNEMKAYSELEKWVGEVGVPQNVFFSIKKQATDKYPNDYSMQKYVIEEQVKAYLDLNR
ncbi:MAG: hypothetical protein HYX66_09760 [Ignavibacteria bacterium]|nr:hypothetical protein [Ignavibacteria bacterium]